MYVYLGVTFIIVHKTIYYIIECELVCLPQEGYNGLCPGDPPGTRHTSSTRPVKLHNQNQ